MAITQTNFDYLIIGGGTSAGYACRELVAQGAAPGSIAILGEEGPPPYERPALTKAYLHPPSAKVVARLPGFHTCVGIGGERQTPEWYKEKGITLINGIAMSVDAAAKTVTSMTNDGAGTYALSYGKLFLATGCTALRVSAFGVKGDGLEGVFYIRDEKNAAELVSFLKKAGDNAKVVICGGGYIGLECAAALVGWGIDTSVVVSGERLMPRLFNAELSQWMEDQYVSRGVKFVKKDKVAEFVAGEDGALGSVTLGSGGSLPCTISVVGVGGKPVVGYCQGLKMESGGFAVDGNMQTSDPNIYAIGDIAAFPSRYGGVTRCEHVDHARKSAAQAVQAAMEKSPELYNYLPFFYSRVFEYSDAPVVFNFFGHEAGECKIVETSPTSISALWINEEKVCGALMMGSPGPDADDAAKLKELALTTPDEATAVAALAKPAEK